MNFICRSNRHQSAIEFILRYIATSNASFRSIDDENLQNAFKMLDPTFQIPRRTTLKTDMIQLSKNIQSKMKSDLFGMDVSILFDSCKKWGRNYQGVILYTPIRLYLWSAIATENSKSATLAETVALIVEDLKDSNINTISICTDNCPANVAAFDGRENSAQDKSGVHFIRSPCSAHTSNLALKDMFESDKEYGFVYQTIQTLMQHIPKGSYRHGFTPRFLTIRWSSLYDCVNFIIENYTLYEKSRLQIVHDSLNLIDEKIGWLSLQNILQIIMDLINSVEKDLASIADVAFNYMIAFKKLRDLDDPAAILLSNYLKLRFTKTCPFMLPLFAFLLTGNGLIYFQENEDEQEIILDSAINGMKSYMAERNFTQDEIDENEIYFYCYLINFNYEDFQRFDRAIFLWDYLYLHINETEYPKSFIKFVREVLQIPSSESAVERLFAHLSKIVSGQNCNISPETLNARLIIKFDSIFERAGPIKFEEISKDPYHLLKLHKFKKPL